MSVRRARGLSVLWEWFQGAAVVTIAIPPLFAFLAFFQSQVALVLGSPVAPSRLLWGWALATTGVLAVSWVYLYLRLSGMKDHLHPSETRGSLLFRLATGMNVDHVERRPLGDLELVRMDLRYLHGHAIGPVLLETGADLAVFVHRARFCVLPGPVPPMQVVSRKAPWTSTKGAGVLAGPSLPLGEDLDPLVHVTASDPTAVVPLFADGLAAFVRAHPTWSFETWEDRVLAYEICPSASARARPVTADPDGDAAFLELVLRLTGAR